MLQDIIIAFVRTNPELIVIIMLFVLSYFRQEITEVIQVKILKKTLKKDKELKQRILDVVASMKYVSCFNEQVITTDSAALYEEIRAVMDKMRKDGRPLVISLAEVKNINEMAREAIRDAIRYAIDRDDLNLLVIFPKHNATLLWEEIDRYIQKKGSTTVRIKKDSREGDRVTIVNGGKL